MKETIILVEGEAGYMANRRCFKNGLLRELRAKAAPRNEEFVRAILAESKRLAKKPKKKIKTVFARVSRKAADRLLSDL